MSGYLYWGKSRKGENHRGDEYHLLQWHSLDVAACGYVMVMENHFNAASLFATLGIDGMILANLRVCFSNNTAATRWRAASAMLTTAAITTPSPARGCGKTILVIAWRRA